MAWDCVAAACIVVGFGKASYFIWDREQVCEGSGVKIFNIIYVVSLFFINVVCMIFPHSTTTAI